MQKFPFSVKKRRQFESLWRRLSKQKILSVEDCERGRKVKIVDRNKFLDLTSASVFLLSSISSLKNDMSNLEKFVFLTWNGNVKNDIEFVLKMIPSEEEALYKRVEELFNSLLALSLAEDFCFHFLYPNAYIEELGGNSHELDIVGGYFKGKIPYCLLVEITSGKYLKRFSRDVEFFPESALLHFKKTVFKKWIIERKFEIQTKLAYITLFENFNKEENELIKTVFEVDNRIRSFCLYPKEFANFSYQELKMSIERFLEEIRSFVCQ